MNTWLQDVGEIVRVEAWNGDQCATLTTRCSRWTALRRPSSPRRGAARHAAHRAQTAFLALARPLSNLNRTDGGEVALFPIENVVHPLVPGAGELLLPPRGDALHRDRERHRLRDLDDPYACIQKGLLRQIIFALATAEREVAEATSERVWPSLPRPNEEQHHRARPSDFYVEVLQVLRRYSPLASSDDESVEGGRRTRMTEQPERNAVSVGPGPMAQGVAVDLLPLARPTAPVSSSAAGRRGRRGGARRRSGGGVRPVGPRRLRGARDRHLPAAALGARRAHALAPVHRPAPAPPRLAASRLVGERA